MSGIFGSAYAEAYDQLYHDQDFAGDVDRLEEIFRQFGAAPIRTVLDLGCGTGQHALLLARRGYEVCGVDRSSAMIAQARRKAAELPGTKSISFQTGDVRDYHCDLRFDAVLLMSAVMSYMLTNADALAALRAARAHLAVGGLLFFDAWYGPAVLAQPPTPRLKICPIEGGQILRTASGKLDTLAQTCEVDFRMWRLTGERVAAQTEETHTVRYFNPLELELLLRAARFELRHLGDFPDFKRPPHVGSRNISIIASAAE